MTFFELMTMQKLNTRAKSTFYPAGKADKKVKNYLLSSTICLITSIYQGVLYDTIVAVVSFTFSFKVY